MGVDDWIAEDMEQGESRGQGGAITNIVPGSDEARYVEGMVEKWAEGEWRGSWPALRENVNRRFEKTWGKDCIRDHIIRQRPDLYARVRRR